MNFSITLILTITIASVIAVPKLKESAPKPKPKAEAKIAPEANTAPDAKTAPGAKTAPEAIKKVAFLNSESMDIEHMQRLIPVPEKLRGVDWGCVIGAITSLASCLTSHSEIEDPHYKGHVTQLNTGVLQCIINLAGQIIPCIHIESLMSSDSESFEHSQESDESHSHSVESYPGHHQRHEMHHKMGQL